MGLELAGTYTSADGNDVFIAVSETTVVRWDGTTLVSTEHDGTLQYQFDLPASVIIRTWCTTFGTLDEITLKFFNPKAHRDLTKRPYSSFRNTGIYPPAEGEDPGLSWLLFRLHRVASTK